MTFPPPAHPGLANFPAGVIDGTQGSLLLQDCADAPERRPAPLDANQRKPLWVLGPGRFLFVAAVYGGFAAGSRRDDGISMFISQCCGKATTMRYCNRKIPLDPGSPNPFATLDLVFGGGMAYPSCK
jgi:hypothetical protein